MPQIFRVGSYIIYFWSWESEPLKHELAGYWSRRINGEHRLVYKVSENSVLIASCKYRY